MDQANDNAAGAMYDIQKILATLPHRYPFVMIDRILELKPGEKVLGLKNVSYNEPFFQGHFPGDPIMPGVLILEAMGQTGGVLAYSLGDHAPGTPIYFSAMDKVRFRRPVVPGDQLIMEMRLLRSRKKLVKMQGVATVEGQVCAQAEFMAVWAQQA